MEEAEEELSEKQAKRLAILRQKATGLEKTYGKLNKADSCKQYRQKLMFKTGFRERVPNLTLPMTEAEQDLCQLLTLQSFSYVINQLATADVDKLKHWVGDPEAFLKHKETTAWVSSDAVPVYLDISTSKQYSNSASGGGKRGRQQVRGGSAEAQWRKCRWKCQSPSSKHGRLKGSSKRSLHGLVSLVNCPARPLLF